MWKKIYFFPAILTFFFCLSSHKAQAQSIINVSDLSSSRHNNSMSQINSVSQLRDVNPTDWSYEALRGLVERYGCIVGYPDQTYRGNRALSRY